MIALDLCSDKTSTPSAVFERLSENDGKVHSGIAGVLFDAGAYVAGGAARHWYKWQSAGDNVRERRWAWHTFDLSFSGHNGDIDFFFPSEESFFNAVRRLNKEFDVVTADSATRACEQFHVGRIKYQLVKFKFAPPEEMLDEFDIVNCCVAFTPKTVIYPSRWEELETTNTLDVRLWTSPHTICRVARYCSRYELSLHPNARDLFAEFALEHALRLRKDPLPMQYCEHPYTFSHSAVLNWLSSMFPQMTNSDLVLLATAYSDQKYNWAIQELFKRSPVLKNVQGYGHQ